MTPKEDQCYLSDLEIGYSGKIIGYSKESFLNRRLLEMGFVPGRNIEYTNQAPLKDPKSFKIGGSEIAIRNEQAKNIIIQPYKKLFFI